MAHAQAPRITVGVDTHLDVHVAHAGDQLGRRVDTVQVPTTPTGYHDLHAWARGLGEPSPGAWRAPAPTAPPWPASLSPTARLSWRSTGLTAKPGAALVTAPAELREQLRGLSAAALVRTAAALAPGPIAGPLAAAMLALRTLAARHQALSAEISSLTTELDRLTAKAAPQLVALFGVGQDSAGALLVAAGDNPGRLRSDACFSMLCGASPASSATSHGRCSPY